MGSRIHGYRWIALEIFYLKSFDFNWIGSCDQPQIAQNRQGQSTTARALAVALWRHFVTKLFDWSFYFQNQSCRALQALSNGIKLHYIRSEFARLFGFESRPPWKFLTYRNDFICIVQGQSVDSILDAAPNCIGARQWRTWAAGHATRGLFPSFHPVKGGWGRVGWCNSLKDGAGIDSAVFVRFFHMKSSGWVRLFYFPHFGWKRRAADASALPFRPTKSLRMQPTIPPGQLK